MPVWIGSIVVAEGREDREIDSTAKVFKSGNSEAIRLPKEFQLRDSEVYIKKMGNCVVIIPKDDPWKIVEESIHKFTSDLFEEGREQPPPQKSEGLDDLYA